MAEAKPKQSSGVCVGSVASINKLARSIEWLESQRQKILSGNDNFQRARLAGEIVTPKPEKKVSFQLLNVSAAIECNL